MPPRSPLPQRHGLDAAWMRTPDRDPLNPMPWPTMGDWVAEKIGEHVDVPAYFADERFVYQSGKKVLAHDRYAANTFVWFHRELRPETHVPGEMPIVYRDDKIIVVDKPPFLSSIPRGRHVLQSVVARLRTELDLPELTPAHRLDRMTSGLLILTTEKKWRGPYQMIFQNRAVEKTYLALADSAAGLDLPTRVSNHLLKIPGERRVRVVPEGQINAISEIVFERDLGENSIYRLNPITGKTHQLRQHMTEIGRPIHGDPFFPELLPTEIDDFSVPLQLLAQELRFQDPLTEKETVFRSEREFPIAVPDAD